MNTKSFLKTLTKLVDLPRESTGGAELGYKVVQPCHVPAIFGVEPSKRALEPQTRKNCWGTMAGTNYIYDILLMLRGQ